MGVALLAAACTSAPAPGPTATPSPDVDPDAEVAATVAADEAMLIALYDAAIAAHPALAPELTALRDEHAAHAGAVGSPPTPAGAPAVGSRAEAVAALLAAEERAVAQRTAACEAATAIELARLTALIAASEAGHAQFLRGIS